jgi:3-deoxy-D-manno-octulosonic-acid transferase
VAEQLESAAALATVASAGQLAQALDLLLADAQAAAASGARAAAVVAANRGAAARALALIAAVSPAT